MPNHVNHPDNIWNGCGEYRYFDSENTRRFDSLIAEDLADVRAGDVVLLPMAAVHNPTGRT